MVSDFVPFFAPLAGVALTAICCAVSSWCSTRRVLYQNEGIHQRLLALEQAPAKVIVHGPTPPVYYQPQPMPSVSQPMPSVSQPKPSAPPAAGPPPYPSYYPPYSSAYQSHQLPVTR